ncbi:hypothetical protein S40293_06789 [Stachybotrys chartarum IBT 40293]|nr:hypothetical protein S40293_06789 [Stachybotrys chartarum IBT 40293]
MAATSGETGTVPANIFGSAPQPMEPLACVACRGRKLKCDRMKPACARCIKFDVRCVYPESRRKPAARRRNVKELEARLAQVEDFLKEVNKPADGQGRPSSSGDLGDRISAEADIDVDFNLNVDVDVEAEVDAGENVLSYDFNFDDTPPIQQDAGQGQIPQQVPPSSGFGFSDSPNLDFGDGALISMGLSEHLPPMQMMQELNSAFFRLHYHYNPVIHPDRYLCAFYGAPMSKPPMCLQYAVWALGSLGNDKYAQYSDGSGEHTVTVSHAQAWVLIATYEAKLMLFTRAAVSTSRAIKLIHIMGLHRVDADASHLPMVLPSAENWAALEERRRVFWGAFVIDSHAAIATGCPCLIYLHDVTTRLPASDEAFKSGTEEKTAWVEDVFSGAPYSGFASTIAICHIFKLIVAHVHRLKNDGQGNDLANGSFWTNHRDLDNKLSSLFMFLPDKFCLPQNARDPTAVNMNLSLHAGVICLHHAAIEMACKYRLPESLRKACMNRLRTAAEGIAGIIRMTCYDHPAFTSPLGGITLYVATTVYTYSAKSDPTSGLSSVDHSNLDVILRAAEATAWAVPITRRFIRQVCRDIERNNLTSMMKFPVLTKFRESFNQEDDYIPVIARSHVVEFSREPGVFFQTLLGEKTVHSENADADARPVNNEPSALDPPFSYSEAVSMTCYQGLVGAASRNLETDLTTEAADYLGTWGTSGVGCALDKTTPSLASGIEPSRNKHMDAHSYVKRWIPRPTGTNGQAPPFGDALPDRTNSSASSPQNRGARTETQSTSSHTSPTTGQSNKADDGKDDFCTFPGHSNIPMSQATGADFALQTEGAGVYAMPGDGIDPWDMLGMHNQFLN